MKTHWLQDTTAYDGSQLAPHWIRQRTGLIGDALVAFRGPCRLPVEQIADVADISGPGIAGDDMVHFVWERFDDGDLERAVLRQRLLASQAQDLVRILAPTADLRRDGDDLYVSDRKLTISVATRSLVSTLIHFAANVTTDGTPVPTASLEELAIDPADFAARLLALASAEEDSIHDARCQVRGRGDGGPV